jgi:hypothetical protein
MALGQRAGQIGPETLYAGLNGPSGPCPFWAGSGPSSSPRLILAFWTLPPWFVSFWGHHPRDQGSGVFSYEVRTLRLSPRGWSVVSPWSCHLWKWFLLALEHERNSSFAPLNLLWLRPFCSCFPAKTQYFQIHIRSWTFYIISVPSGGLVANHNLNQCITSTLGWRKFTVNISPMLKPCLSSGK